MPLVLNGTTGVSGVDGSAGTPALQGTDSNTGIVFGADTISLVEGGTAAFSVDSSANASLVGTLAMGSSFLRNRLINGNFSVAQRGTSFTSTGSANNDDTYNLDRWYILSDGNDVVDITQATDVPANGSKYSIGLDVETTNKKFGIAQIIENINCQELIGNTVSLSFKAKVSSTTKLDNVKAAVIAWSSTADSVTSDIVSAWGAEGTNPTLASNLTYENTPANLNVTTSWATYKIENIAVDTASTTNIIVFIWSDVTDTTLGDFLYITDVQIERGSVATPFERRQYGTELMLCQRYYWKATSSFLGNSYAAGYVYDGRMFFKSTMRATPTIDAGATYTVGGGSAGTVALFGSGNSADVVILYNSANNWTIGTSVSVTAGFNSEL